MAQLSCTNAHCRVQLMYPRGAVQVQCSLCGTLNDAAQANQLGHVMCGGCQITLMYAFGAQSVKCAVCNHVTPAAAGGAPRAHAPPPAMQQPAYLPPPAMQYHQQPQQYHQQQYPQQYAQPPLPQGYPQAAGAAGLGAADAGRPPMQHVVLVENPPTLDDSGQEVQHVSLGMAPKAEPA
jgi:LSD1 subclass zinc finger protein